MLQPENTINIDLRSDVVTRAPTEMLKLMSEYQFVHESRDYDDLITVKLEGIMANMFGKESGIFFPTTTMANVASVIGWAKPGSEVIIASNSHSVERESSSFALLAGVQTRQIGGESGLFTVEQGTLNAPQPAAEYEKPRIL